MCGAQVCVEVLAGGKTQWGFALQVHCVFVTDEKQRSDIELEVPQRCLALLMRAAVEAHKLMDWSPAPGGSGWEGLSNGGGSQGGGYATTAVVRVPPGKVETLGQIADWSQ